MDPSSQIEKANVSAFDAAVKSHLELSPLHAPEVMIFLDYIEQIRDKRVLDAGCGTGRTSHFLKYLTTSYLGFDYSAKMVETAKARYPNLDLRVLNAKNLDSLDDQSFDFILFSYNGIDYVNQEDRLTILSELHKKLSPNGLLAFSSHNLSHLKSKKIRPPRFGLSLNPCRAINKIKNWWIKSRNYRRIVNQQVWADEYAIVVDGGIDFSLLTYYSSAETQIRQLQNAGFEVLRLYDTNGHVLEGTLENSHSPWIHYVARKRS
ncbi:MAG: class I SAM-dependent methyltransferase [Magnetococcales bacterium]|nr:class I SAM-dependent methyltransferase [Magnetococcales bacterium]